jgi:hypothetical protein
MIRKQPLSDYKMEDIRTIPKGNGAIVAYKQTHIGTEQGKPFAFHIWCQLGLRP